MAHGSWSPTHGSGWGGPTTQPPFHRVKWRGGAAILFFFFFFPFPFPFFVFKIKTCEVTKRNATYQKKKKLPKEMLKNIFNILEKFNELDK